MAEAELKLLKTRGGALTLLCGGRFLHSRYDPLREARQQISELKIAGREQMVIFFGAGLGYTLREFCSAHSNLALWFEPNAEIARLALEHSRLQPFIDARQLIQVTQESDLDGDGAGERAQEIFRGRKNSDIHFMVHRASCLIDDRYLSFQGWVQDFLSRRAVNFATLIRFERLWVRNLLSNFPLLARARRVRELFGQAKGRAAIICGAGPSLSEGLPELRSRRSQALLIAVDSALQVLSEAGIDPDLIVSVDPQPLNRRYLENYQGNALFVTDPAASYLSLRLLASERLFYTWSPFPLAQLFFEATAGDPGKVAFGGSVSTNAYDLAVQMGCSPILLLGQDLSFSYGLAHAKGAVLEEHLSFSESRIRRREMHNYRQLSALPARLLPGLNGEKVVSNDKLAIFYRWFERRFMADSSKGIRIINAAPKGVLFSAAERAGLEILDNLPKQEAPDHFSRLYDERPDGRLDERADGRTDGRANRIAGGGSFGQRLELLLEEFADYSGLLEEALRLSRQAERLMLRGREQSRNREKRARLLRRLSGEMDAIDRRLAAQQELSSLAGSIVQKSILQITEGYQEDEEVGETDPAFAAIRRSLSLYTDLLKSVQFYACWLRRSLQLHQRSL